MAERSHHDPKRATPTIKTPVNSLSIVAQQFPQIVDTMAGQPPFPLPQPHFELPEDWQNMPLLNADQFETHRPFTMQVFFPDHVDISHQHNILLRSAVMTYRAGYPNGDFAHRICARLAFLCGGRLQDYSIHPLDQVFDNFLLVCSSVARRDEVTRMHQMALGSSAVVQFVNWHRGIGSIIEPPTYWTRIRILGLPLHLCHRIALIHLVSGFGTPMRVAPHFEVQEFTQIRMLVKGGHPAYIPHHLAISQDPFAKLIQIVVEGYIQVHPTRDEPPYLGPGMPWTPPPPPPDQEEASDSNSGPSSGLSHVGPIQTTLTNGEGSSKKRPRQNGDNTDNTWKLGAISNWLTTPPTLPQTQIRFSNSIPFVFYANTLSDTTSGLHMASRKLNSLPAPHIPTSLTNGCVRFLVSIQLPSVDWFLRWEIYNTKNYLFTHAKAFVSTKMSLSACPLPLNFTPLVDTGKQLTVNPKLVTTCQNQLQPDCSVDDGSTDSPPGFHGPPRYLTQLNNTADLLAAQLLTDTAQPTSMMVVTSAHMEQQAGQHDNSSPPGFLGPPKFSKKGRKKATSGPIRRSPRLNSIYKNYCTGRKGKAITLKKPDPIYNLKKAPMRVEQAADIVSTAGFELSTQLQEKLTATALLV